MNYISQINAYHNWKETHPQSASEVALYFVLLHINNKAGWKSKFTVALSTLVGQSGMSKSSVERNRMNLEKAGLIKCCSRSGNKAAEYSIRNLYSPQDEIQDEIQDEAQDEIQDEAQGEAQDEAQAEAQADAISKQDETILLSIRESKQINENVRNKYLDYVYLSKKEYKKLTVEYGEEMVEKLITDLNNYIGKGKKPGKNNHYFTIKSFYSNQMNWGNWKSRIGATKSTKEVKKRGNSFINNNQRHYNFEELLKRMDDKLDEEVLAM